MVEERATFNAPSEAPNLVVGEQRFTSLVSQFFLIPMLIAITAVAIFVGVKMMTGEEKDPLRLVNEIRLEHGAARWQVAYELNSRLVRDPEARRNPKLVPEIMRAFMEIQPSRDQDDMRTRTYLVTILGTLRNPVAMAVVRPAMRDPDGATQVAAIQAAGSIGDASVIPDLVEFAKDDDAGLRKAGVFALGLFSPRRRAAEGREPLTESARKEALESIYGAFRSPVDDVRWNAALALARWGETESATALRTMLDRAYLEKTVKPEDVSMASGMVDEVMVNAMKGVLELKDTSFRPLLESLRTSDRSMEVRQAAGTAMRLKAPSANGALRRATCGWRRGCESGSRSWRQRRMRGRNKRKSGGTVVAVGVEVGVAVEVGVRVAVRVPVAVGVGVAVEVGVGVAVRVPVAVGVGVPDPVSGPATTSAYGWELTGTLNALTRTEYSPGGGLSMTTPSTLLVRSPVATSLP
jgi:HEAT repeat protein